MMTPKIIRCAAALAALAFVVCAVPTAGAARPAAFTVTVKSGFLRSEASFAAPRTYSVFLDQVYTVTGRTGDSAWLQLHFPGAASGTWVPAAYGRVSGDLNSIPVAAHAAGDAPAPVNAPPTPAFIQPAGIPPRVSFTLIAKSAFARGTPGTSGPLAYSLFRDQTFSVLAKTADAAWLQIDFAYAAGEVWVSAHLGAVHGNLNAVPVAGAAPTPTPAAPGPPAGPGPADPIIPVVSPHAREIYQRGLALGNDPRSFSKVGDCHSVSPYFLVSFDDPTIYRLGGPYAYLQETIDQFAGSFAREGQTAHIGLNTSTVFNPIWSDPKVCERGESPVECEYRLHRPSLVFIGLGTNGNWLTDAEYEAGMRRIIQFFLDHGVVPILSTKADDLDGDERFNRIVVRLAGEYDVPLWNFRLAVEGLPDHGLLKDGFHLRWGPSYFDDPSQALTGWQMRNLTALQALDAVWRAVR